MMERRGAVRLRLGSLRSVREEVMRKSRSDWTVALVRLAAFTALLALAACGGESSGSSTPPTPKPDVETDTGSQFVDVGSGGEDADASTPDVPEEPKDVAADVPGPGGCPVAGKAGCPCSSVSDCDSGFCIETPEGQKCAGTCTDKCSDDSQKCVTVSMPGTNDSVNICVPKIGKLCTPCNKNQECAGPGNADARCVDQGDAGAFCGIGCKDDKGCPDGYSCKVDAKDVAGNVSGQCVVKGGGACTCSPAAIQQAASTTCYNSSNGNKCEGTRTCKPNGLTDCISAAQGDEICDGKDNDCDGQTDESTCDDKNDCTTDKCAGAAGCSHLNNTLNCDADSSVCTKNDYCSDGVCMAGPKQVCDDGNPCTDDACDAAKGCTYVNNSLGCNADDTDCTQNDACKEGTCQPGPKKPCASDDPCVPPTCKISNGKCNTTPVAGTPCNDGNACTDKDKCGGSDGGLCAGSELSCDDKNPCTADTCDTTTGCSHKPVGGICEDGSACTVGESCIDGACAGGKAKNCDDANPCTVDGCDPATPNGCTNKPQNNGVPCDDGNPCTVGDACVSGQCTSGGNNCGCTGDADCAGKETNKCEGTLYCDKSKAPFVCKINPLTVVKCDTTQNNQCQTVACNAATGKCVLNKKEDTSPCDADGNVCTGPDQCLNGFCVAGSTSACDDNNACTDDSCDPVKGCANVVNQADCDADGNACTVGDACVKGQCLPGKSTNCDDGEGCTKDSCDPKSGQCVNAQQNGSCSDNNICTSGDACGNDENGKWTCLAGTAPPCDDGNPCTLDLCSPATGCKNTVQSNIEVPCYSGPATTKDKGQCKSGKSTCDSSGKPGACVGQVLPATNDVCDGVDNDCNGVADPGCSPTGFSVRSANVELTGGDKLQVRAVVGASDTGGGFGGTGKFTVTTGFFAWLKAALGL
jgi:hypothetical protein